MNDHSKNIAFTQIIKAMQHEATDLLERVDLAAEDMENGLRNGAVGALLTVDESLKRIASLLSGVMVIHRITPSENFQIRQTKSLGIKPGLFLSPP
ncbi:MULTISPECIES: hypothetical protein [Rhizobium/Agrobacterium group]|uniref:hypothetical protein n=1 Tax=Rhizobium/Agrobacterium group TaxID=227290 RepID=UPI001177825B|nr:MULTISPECIES: hypothetical protein [Rhizobium/Agrobacterium group]MCF1485564.1 hypothetical protein [Allorhizobium ampelinum]NSZ46254.1 hypothetical protein [Agrobacterium vitis]NTA25351.1 hypothetical protein [Allorhizobium ampelinum]